MGRDEIEIKRKPVDFPCKGCTDRHAGCHSECEGYLAAKAENMKYNQQERKSIEEQLDYVRYRIESAQRQRRKSRSGR